MAERVLRGRYRIVRHIARGGMAEVYVAEDQLLSRTVAVKVLFPELAGDDAFVERFRREARAAASLNHHNIVSVYDFGDDEGSWFIVMEYVDGPTLRDIIRREGQMAPARTSEIGAEVAAALAAAHAEGIVHRDVKPANVLLAGPAETVKVTDFGIARAANALQGLTMPGTVLGTATYLSPEQAQGHSVDHRTDIYSLGLVLYEMLAGRPPFTGESPVAVAYQSLSQTAPPPSSHNSRVPPALDAVVMKAMSKDPSARQATAEDLREELLAVDRAVGDPDATIAVAPIAAVEATGMAGPATSVLPPPVASEPAVEHRLGPAPPDAVRRRRAAVIALLALLTIGLIAALLLLGGGDDEGSVAVPSVVGLSVTDATRALEDAGLRVRVTEREGPGSADRVVDQDPDAAATVSRGSTVELFVPRAAATTTTRSAPTTRATTTTAAPTTTQAPTTTAPTTTVPPATVTTPSFTFPTTSGR